MHNTYLYYTYTCVHAVRGHVCGARITIGNNINRVMTIRSRMFSFVRLVFFPAAAGKKF